MLFKKTNLPIEKLDYSNCIDKIDYDLNFYPFINSLY